MSNSVRHYEGEGFTAYDDTAGVWEAFANDGFSHDGNPLVKWIGAFATEAEAREALREPARATEERSSGRQA